jgi:hypothetical protein
MGTERDPAQDLPLLKQRLVQVAELGGTCTEAARISDYDDFGFMTLNFLCKQMDHAGSLLLLTPRRDSVLIARTMFDGLCQLLWAYQRPTERGCQWRAFSCVHDWRVMQAELDAGRAVDEKDRRIIENALAEYGQIFLRKGASTVTSPDPYYKHWRAGMSLSEMASAVGGKEQYEDYYASASDWEHWGHGGFGNALSRSSDQITFSSDSIRICADSLFRACQYLLQTIDITNAYLHLSKEEAIGSMRSSLTGDFPTCVNP